MASLLLFYLLSLFLTEKTKADRVLLQLNRKVYVEVVVGVGVVLCCVVSVVL